MTQEKVKSRHIALDIGPELQAFIEREIFGGAAKSAEEYIVACLQEAMSRKIRSTELLVKHPSQKRLWSR